MSNSCCIVYIITIKGNLWGKTEYFHKFGHSSSNCDHNSLPGMTLAYIVDLVYELLILKKNPISRYIMMLCAKVSWNYFSGSGEEISSIYFCYFVIILLGKGCGPDLHKLEFLLFRDTLCQVWLKLAQCFWRRFLYCINVFSLFHYHLPLRKGVVLDLNKWIAFAKGFLCA